MVKMATVWFKVGALQLCGQVFFMPVCRNAPLVVVLYRKEYISSATVA